MREIKKLLQLFVILIFSIGFYGCADLSNEKFEILNGSQEAEEQEEEITDYADQNAKIEETRIELMVMILSGPTKVTASSTAEFVFECTRSPCTFECSIDEGEFHICEEIYENIEAGEHSIYVVAVDQDNNESMEAGYEWVVDQAEL